MRLFSKILFLVLLYFPTICFGKTISITSSLSLILSFLDLSLCLGRQFCFLSLSNLFYKYELFSITSYEHSIDFVIPKKIFFIDFLDELGLFIGEKQVLRKKKSVTLPSAVNSWLSK
jgi:hypothetical protein